MSRHGGDGNKSTAVIVAQRSIITILTTRVQRVPMNKTVTTAAGVCHTPKSCLCVVLMLTNKERNLHAK